MNDTVWADFATWQLFGIGICFVWSGFVRSGLGFGGAALTLPMLLIIHNDPLLYLPAICCQLLFFSLITVATRLANVNWRFLGKLIVLITVPFAAGLFGLLNLPVTVLSLFVYAITLFYGLTYAMNKVMVSRSRTMDAVCIVGGGYVSGVSLIGAPLIVAFSTTRLPATQLRDTLFVMWIVLVIGKLSTFSVAGVDMQWLLTAATMPLVGFGHWMGLRVHQSLITGDRKRFNQVIGSGLCMVSILGLWSVL